MSERLVQVRAAGAVTALGARLSLAAAAARASVPRLSEHPTLTSKGDLPLVTARVPFVPDTMSAQQRLAVLVEGAMLDLLADPRGKPMKKPALRLALPNIASRQSIARVLAAVSEKTEVELPVPKYIALESVDGCRVLADACRSIQAGEQESVLLVVADTLLLPEVIAELENKKRLFVRDAGSGLIPGEAAAALLLCGRDTTAKQTLVTGLGMAREEATREQVNTARGLTQATRAACARLGAEHKLDCVVSDQNGERARTEEYALMTIRHAKHMARPGEYETLSTTLGDTGMATPALQLAMVHTWLSRGWVSHRRCLLTSSAETGTRLALLVASHG